MSDAPLSDRNSNLRHFNAMLSFVPLLIVHGFLLPNANTITFLFSTQKGLASPPVINAIGQSLRLKVII